jgi:hypothetical protein
MQRVAKSALRKLGASRDGLQVISYKTRALEEKRTINRLAATVSTVAVWMLAFARFDLSPMW